MLNLFSIRDRKYLYREFYLGYKKLAKTEDEFITKIRFQTDFTDFNFEKVCQTHLSRHRFSQHGDELKNFG